MSRIARAWALVACVAVLGAVGPETVAAGSAPAAGAAKAKKKRVKHHRKACNRSKGSKRRRRAKARRCRSRHPLRRAPARPGATAPAQGGGQSPSLVPDLGPSGPLGRYLSVSAREFRLTLSRPALAAGTDIVELRNQGEDPHNLVLSPDDGSHTPIAAFPSSPSGSISAQTVGLSPGRYYLFCSLAGHEALGMHATLRVQ
jgi:hypothetical protein